MMTSDLLKFVRYVLVVGMSATTMLEDSFAPFAHGFLSKDPLPKQIAPQRGRIHESFWSPKKGEHNVVLFMSDPQDDDNGPTIERDDGNGDGPLAYAKQMWEQFSTSSAYRTILFSAALCSSRSVREFLGPVGIVAIFAGSWAIYSYDTSFNYLVDVVTPRRQAAVKAIRQAKTAQLTNGTSSKSNDLERDMADLLNEYEKSLREELKTRVLIPPSIWVIPMDASQEDRSLAPQWLGLEITDQYTLEPAEGK